MDDQVEYFYHFKIFTFIFHRRPNKGKLILTEIFPSVQKHDMILRKLK